VKSSLFNTKVSTRLTKSSTGVSTIVLYIQILAKSVQLYASIIACAKIILLPLSSSHFVVSNSQLKASTVIFDNNHVVASIHALAILFSHPVIICDSSQVVVTSKSKSVLSAFIILGVGRYVVQDFIYTQL
jgi:hypothetical protein